MDIPASSDPVKDDMTTPTPPDGGKLLNYDPNITWVKQKVEITLQQWEYTATLYQEVGGNCFGLDVLETAVGNAFEAMIPDDDNALTSVTLTAPNGDTLLCEDDEDRQEEWLKDMVVGVRIIEQPTPPRAAP